MNKPILISQIAIWIWLLQEFDFKVVYKPGRVHFLLDYLSKISHEEPTKGVDDQLPNIHLFNVGVDCYGQIIEYLKKGYFDNDVNKEEKSQIVIRARPYTLYDRQLYKLCWNLMSTLAPMMFLVCLAKRWIQKKEHASFQTWW